MQLPTSDTLTCEWDHITRSNPNGKRCGRPATVEVNGLGGYYVCGVHASSARRIGDVEQMRLTERDIKWAERDARRKRHEAIMQESADRERKRLVGIVEAALENWGDPVGITSWTEAADVAVAALEADGVVFARLGSWEDDDDN